MACTGVCLVYVPLWLLAPREAQQAATVQAVTAMVLPAMCSNCDALVPQCPDHFGRLSCLEYNDGDLGKQGRIMPPRRRAVGAAPLPGECWPDLGQGWTCAV